MDALLTDLTEWLVGVPPSWAYAVILTVAYLENVVPPIPGDLLVVFGGYLAGVGHLSLASVVLLATIGGMAGFMTMYAIGSRLGEAVMDPHRLRFIPKRHVGRARGWLRRRGYAVVAANRFLSGLRSVISLSVGMAHMPAGRTAVWATFSALVWTAAISALGYFLGDNLDLVQRVLSQYGLVITFLIVVGGLIHGGRILAARRRADPEEGFIDP